MYGELLLRERSSVVSKPVDGFFLLSHSEISRLNQTEDGTFCVKLRIFLPQWQKLSSLNGGFHVTMRSKLVRNELIKNFSLVKEKIQSTFSRRFLSTYVAYGAFCSMLYILIVIKLTALKFIIPFNHSIIVKR